MEYWLKPLLSTSPATVPLTAERFHALAAARAIIDLCKEISLMMDVFGRSMVAYEATLHERAFAWAFTPENREPREFADETVPEVSLRVLTVLTAFRAYVDGSKGHAGALANAQAGGKGCAGIAGHGVVHNPSAIEYHAGHPQSFQRAESRLARPEFA